MVVLDTLGGAGPWCLQMCRAGAEASRQRPGPQPHCTWHWGDLCVEASLTLSGVRRDIRFGSLWHSVHVPEIPGMEGVEVGGREMSVVWLVVMHLCSV